MPDIPEITVTCANREFAEALERVLAHELRDKPILISRIKDAILEDILTGPAVHIGLSKRRLK